MEQLPGLTPVLCILLLLPTWAAGLEVHQSPRTLQAAPGDTATLNCSFQNPQGSMAKATWTRDGVVLNSAPPFYTGRLIMSHLDLLRKGEAMMTLQELEPRDSGLYRCNISILQGESGTGQGTKLSVTGRNQSDPDNQPIPMGCGSPEVLYQAAIALELLLILILLVVLFLKRCRALPCSQPRRREPQVQGSWEAAETKGLHYAEIKVKTPRRTEQVSNHAQRR